MRSLIIAAAMLLVGLSPAYADTACVFDNRTDQRLNMPQANAETLLAMERYSPCPEATPTPASVQGTNGPPGYRTVTWRDTISLTGPSNMRCVSTPQQPRMLFRCTMIGLPWASAGNVEIYERAAIPERNYRRDVGHYLINEDQAHLHVCRSGGRSEVEVAYAPVPVPVPTAHGTFTGWELYGIFPDCANDPPHMTAARGVDIPLGPDYGVFVVVSAAGWLADRPIIVLDLDDDLSTLIGGISVAEPAS